MTTSQEVYIRARVKVRNDNKKLYNKILKAYEYKCAVCGWHLDNITPNGKTQKQGGCDLHHITPWSEGGENTKDNLILLCPNCHKMADNEVISRDELTMYLRDKPRNNIEYLKQQHKLISNTRIM